MAGRMPIGINRPGCHLWDECGSRPKCSRFQSRRKHNKLAIPGSRCTRLQMILAAEMLQDADSTLRLITIKFAIASACANHSTGIGKRRDHLLNGLRQLGLTRTVSSATAREPSSLRSKSKRSLPCVSDRGCEDHVISRNGSATACASDVIGGISGHGFLIASDSLTKHPSGPGMQPVGVVRVKCHHTQILVTYQSKQQYPSLHPPS